MEKVKFGNIFLRRAMLSDYEYIKSLHQNADVIKYCMPSKNTNISEALFFGNNRITFMVENLSSRKVGYIKVFKAPLIHGVCIGTWVVYAIEQSCRNNGYATNALKCFISMCKNISVKTNMPTDPIVLLIDDDNKASIKVAKKCGFTILDWEQGVKGNAQLTDKEHCWIISL